MDASIIICTWNRARLLDRTLERLQRLHIPDGLSWEVLIVNNNCTDETDAVIEKHARRLPLRALHEPTPGKVFAANLAIAHARARLLLWTDDDVLVSETWLEAYANAWRQHPQASLFGGPIIPDFETEPPDWLRRCFSEIGEAYGRRDFPSTLGTLSADSVPYGANYAMPLEVQRQHPFDERFGDFAGRRIGGYETRVFSRMLESGLEGRWVPGASVKHHVPRRAMTIQYLRQLYAAQGVGDIIENPEPFSHRRRLFGKPQSLLREAVSAELKFRVRRWTRSPKEWSHDLVTASYLWGQISAFSEPARVRYQTRTATAKRA